MRACLLLVDVQQDFLRADGLQPPADELLAGIARLLDGCRARGVPVVWVRTTVHRDPDDRPPHWRDADRWACVEGSAGHAFPPPLAPRPDEPVVDKRFYSGFSTGALDAALAAALDSNPEANRAGPDGSAATLIVAGVHAHACVQATVLDAYARGHEVWLADDAVGSDEPLLAAGARRWLGTRAARVVNVTGVLARLDERNAAHAPAPPNVARPEAVRRLAACGGLAPDPSLGSLPARAEATERHHVHRDPSQLATLRYVLRDAEPDELDAVVRAASAAQTDWAARPADERAAALERLAAELEACEQQLVHALVHAAGKPVRDARAEVLRSRELLRSVARQAADGATRRLPDGSLARRRPLGVVALITPFNNPLAIPVGKLAPALLHGNAVVWKPSPAGAGLAADVWQRFARLLPPGLLGLVQGGPAVAEALCDHPDVAAVSLTGGAAAGFAAAARCGRRGVPLQAELGGNNAAIVWDDADLEAAAAALARGAFGGAGQRCTANRRVIVSARIRDELLAGLERATARLVVGDPADEATDLGPLISPAARERVVRQLDAARRAGATLRRPHAGGPDDGFAALAARGAYLRPTLVLDAAPDAAIVQQESFGPVLVLQVADDFDAALALLNGVRQGLAAALFSPDAGRRRRFAAEARAGILRLDAATAGAGVEAPFGGWKSSGWGPPEHGPANVEFHTRWQACDDDRAVGPARSRG